MSTETTKSSWKQYWENIVKPCLRFIGYGIGATIERMDFFFGHPIISIFKRGCFSKVDNFGKWDFLVGFSWSTKTRPYPSFSATITGFSAPERSIIDIPVEAIGEVSVVTLEQRLFSGIESIKHININRGVLSQIETEAFRGCSGLKSVEVLLPWNLHGSPNGFSIGKGAFRDCTNLESVKLPDAHSYNKESGCDDPELWIEEEAFQNCSSIVEISLPRLRGRIEKRAFSGCVRLETIKFLGMTSGWFSLTEEALEKRSRWTIGPEAFAGCASLNSIELPHGLVFDCFGDMKNTFASCHNLRTIAIGEDAIFRLKQWMMRDQFQTAPLPSNDQVMEYLGAPTSCRFAIKPKAESETLSTMETPCEITFMDKLG